MIGDWERKDTCVCYSNRRASPEARGEVEEDAGEDGILDFIGLPLLHLERRSVELSGLLVSEGWGLGDHSHKRIGSSDQWGDGTVSTKVPAVYVSGL